MLRSPEQRGGAAAHPPHEPVGPQHRDRLARPRDQGHRAGPAAAQHVLRALELGLVAHRQRHRARAPAVVEHGRRAHPGGQRAAGRRLETQPDLLHEAAALCAAGQQPREGRVQLGASAEDVAHGASERDRALGVEEPAEGVVEVEDGAVGRDEGLRHRGLPEDRLQQVAGGDAAGSVLGAPGLGAGAVAHVLRAPRGSVGSGVGADGARTAASMVHDAAVAPTAHDVPGGPVLAAVYRSAGSSDVLHVEEVDLPDPGPGEVRVRLRVAGVNPTDWKLRGRAAPASFQVPGQDGAGEVVAVGRGRRPGPCRERVWVWFAAAAGRPWGTAAQETVVPSRQAVGLPDGVSYESGPGSASPR